MNTLSVAGITFQKVDAGSCFLGSNKGGWMYASQRPRYEVRLPDFYIMELPIQFIDLEHIFELQEQDKNGDYETIHYLETQEVKQGFEALKDVKELLDSQRLELRLPSLSEWMHAFSHQRMKVRPGKTELLSDGPVAGNRGAPMDGTPRKNTLLGPAAAQVSAIAVHPKNPTITATTSVPIDRNLPNVIARFVLSPRRETKGPVVPHNADFRATLRSELLWMTILGIIPSFSIPILRGMQDYAISDWPNLLFGGIVAGFLSGAVWRPQRPTIHFEDGVQSGDN